jgi:hypothetical protein
MGRKVTFEAQRLVDRFGVEAYTKAREAELEARRNGRRCGLTDLLYQAK